MGQLQSQHECRNITNITNTRTYLKGSINLQTALAAKEHLVEGQLLEKQLNTETLRML
jgi:hypothetical protein